MYLFAFYLRRLLLLPFCGGRIDFVPRKYAFATSTIRCNDSKRSRQSLDGPDFFGYVTASQVVHCRYEFVDKRLVYEDTFEAQAKRIDQRQEEVTVTVVKWWQRHEFALE